MMCIKNTYHCSKIDIDTNLQAVAAQITIDNENKVTICSIYLKPYELVDNDTDLNLLIAQLPKPFILTGDINAHNPLWENIAKSNKVGKLLERVLCEIQTTTY